MSLWPHQERAVHTIRSLRAEGVRRVLLTIPTGGGKTRVACELVRDWLADGLRVVVYTNRRLLIAQLSGVMKAAGLRHGIRAAGHEDRRDQPLQISSVQTERRRVLDRDQGAWEVHPADVVVIDEAHLNAGPTMRQLLQRHIDQGAFVLGLTASPIDLGEVYDRLVVAGTPSELRACGALVAARIHGCDEPDLSAIGRVKLGEDIGEQKQAKAIMTPTIFGRVWDWFHRLNPDQKPTLLFAPGVKESLWFAEQFAANGIVAAHIDGEEIWYAGKTVKADDASRAELLDGSKAGDIKVICNRFVLREGIDMPWVEHGILACVIGSLQSYIQVCGRLLRASPATGKKLAVIQDHGGNWWRHGSPNADRDWDLALTPAMVAGLREDRLRAKLDPEPVRCPQCACILLGLRCPCGFVIDATKKSRPVIQSDGEPVEVEGDIYRPKRIAFKPDTTDLWKKAYYRGKHGNMTFRQVEGLFAREHFYHPPNNCPLMPKHERDWYRLVRDVPPCDLIPAT